MTDTPVREAIAESIPSESVETTVETPVQAEAPETQPDQAEQPQEEVQKFAEDVDLTGLTPEQLLETKKEWERKYTQKRQQETAELKQLREEIEKLKTHTPPAKTEAQELPTREDVVNAYKTGQITATEYQSYMVEIAREEARQAAREEFETLQSEQRVVQEQAYQEQHLQAFVSADSRLDDNSPSADPALKNEVQGKLAEALDAYIAERGTSQGFDASGLTKHFVQEYDKRIDELVKVRTQQSVQAAKMRDAKMKKSEVRGTNAPSISTSGNSLRSILEEAVIS